MICPRCHATNADSARFCASCGTPLAAIGRDAGERKYATVLFADVVGSTSLAERLDPEEWAEIMNGAFAFLNAAVVSFSGTVGRLMGDAILAFFGAPRALEDHAERAVRAGLAIQEAAREYGAGLRRDYGIDFSVRVGIATGLVVFTTVGDRSRTEYTAMGDTANVAARLQGAAAPGAVLVSGETEALVRHAFDMRPADVTDLKGKSSPVAVFEILAARSERAARRDLSGLGAPLVGRDLEIGELMARVRALRRSEGGFVLITGEAGLGKSRLLAELRRRTEGEPSPPAWIEGRSVSFGQAGTYQLWQQVVRQLLGLPEGTESEEWFETIRKRIDDRNLSADQRMFLGRLLGIEASPSVSVARSAALDEREFRDGLAEAVGGLLDAVAAEAPIVLVLEDLHWADDASVSLLLVLADLVLRSPVLIVASMRPERTSPAWHHGSGIGERLGQAFSALDLRQLDSAQAEAMLAHMLPPDVLPQIVHELILKKSDGNPFFIEEIVRDLVDSGHLVHDGETWRVGGGISGVRIPDTLLGILAARLDRLPRQAKQVAQTGAVIGRTFGHAVVTEVCRMAPAPERIDEVGPHIDTLVGEDMVRAVDPDPVGTYRFKHALSQEAAYAGLLLRRRRELHRRTAAVLERLYGKASEAHAAELAYHSLAGEDWPKAAAYSMRAGAQAQRVYAVADALRHYTSAIRALEELPDTDPRRVVEAVLAWIDVSVQSLAHEALDSRRVMLERLDRAERLARDLDDRGLLARTLVNKGNVLALSGFPVTAYPVLEEASQLATDLGNEPLFLLPFYYATERMVDLDPRAAADQFDQIIELARRYKNRGFEAHAHAVKATALARLGKKEEARTEVGLALELAPKTGSRIKEADTNIVAGIVFLELGDFDRAVELSELGARQALEVGGIQCACGGYFVHGMSQLTIQRLNEAATSFRTSMQLGESPEMQQEMQQTVNLSAGGEAIVRLSNGDEAAVADLEMSMQNARTLNDAYGAAFLARELGMHWVKKGDYGRAAELLTSALAYYRAAAMQPDLVRTLGPAATVLDRIGRRAEADALRQEAAGIAMGQAAPGRSDGPAAGG